MAELITVQEIAKVWNITPRRVQILCKDGRIDGAEYKYDRWLIPADAVKPQDKRKIKQSK